MKPSQEANSDSVFCLLLSQRKYTIHIYMVLSDLIYIVTFYHFISIIIIKTFYLMVSFMQLKDLR